MAFPAEVQKVALALNKKFGAGTVVLGSDVIIPPRITTGSLALDLVVGGGWPGNNWIELVGEASHGKTAVALKTIAANQMNDPDFTTVWVASEEWNKQYAELCGVDTSRVMLVETNIMEDAFQAVVDFLETKEVDAVVIDSLPALVPGAEDDKTMAELTVGRGAMLVNKFFRKAGKATKRAADGSERPVTGIVINQYRQMIGVMFGDDRTTPGGKGKDYSFTIRCEVKRGEWIEIGPTGDKVRIGQQLRIRTIKNKTAPPQQVAFVDFYFAEGGPAAPGEYDYAKEMAAVAILRDIIQRKSGWYHYGGQKWQGLPAVLEAIRDDLNLKDAINREVLDTLRSAAQVPTPRGV